MKSIIKTVAALIAAALLASCGSPESRAEEALKKWKPDYAGKTLGEAAKEFFDSPNYFAYQEDGSCHVNLYGTYDKEGYVLFTFKVDPDAKEPSLELTKLNGYLAKNKRLFKVMMISDAHASLPE